ncbi:hypothetical protein T484DRAFT_1751236 [Baffinella frigidus]|nr:hypothetical protein T484DRAFT_1751236 [Cryptophyta sp. CCMP2293]
MGQQQEAPLWENWEYSLCASRNEESHSKTGCTLSSLQDKLEKSPPVSRNAQGHGTGNTPHVAQQPEEEKGEALFENWDYSRPASLGSPIEPEAESLGTAKRASPRYSLGRSKSAGPNLQVYNSHQDAPVTKHSAVQDVPLCERNPCCCTPSKHTEDTFTSVVFLMWAVSVLVLWGWHVASHLHDDVAPLELAVLVATGSPEVSSCAAPFV